LKARGEKKGRKIGSAGGIRGAEKLLPTRHGI